MTNSVLFVHLPMGPSCNNMYPTIRNGNRLFRVSSKELKKFQKEMGKYPSLCKEVFHKGKFQVQEWVEAGMPLEIKCLFFFQHKRIFTKDGCAKKIDVSNYIKAVHDSLCNLLEIDDSVFFKVYAEKAICSPDCDEMVCVEIMPMAKPFS